MTGNFTEIFFIIFAVFSILRQVGPSFPHGLFPPPLFTWRQSGHGAAEGAPAGDVLRAGAALAPNPFAVTQLACSVEMANNLRWIRVEWLCI